MVRHALVGLVAVALIGACAPLQGAEHTRDTLEMVKKAVAEGKAVLADVREKREWDAGHVKGAKFVPLSQLKAGVKKEDLLLLLPKGKIVYCHCAVGVRSLRAAVELKKLGYDVRPLKPGFRALIEAGFPRAK